MRNFRGGKEDNGFVVEKDLTVNQRNLVEK